MDKWIVTNYQMGAPRQKITVEGFLSDAMRAAEKFPALGLPGTVKEAASKSRVVGIVRAK